MKDEKQKYKKLETIEIFENVTVIFNNGERRVYDAIYPTEEEIAIGRIINNKVFLKCGGIPKDNIKSIEEGIKKSVFKNG